MSVPRMSTTSAARRLVRLSATLLMLACGAAVPTAAQAAVTVASQQPGVFSDTLVFSRYNHIPGMKTLADGSQITWPTTKPVDTGAVTVRNTGGSAIQLTGLSVADGAAFKVMAPTSLPVTIPAGGSQTVSVKFTFDTSAGTPNHRLITSTLTVATNDASTPTRTVKLRGWWQTRPEGGTEPSLQAMVNDLYGFTSGVPSNSQLQKNGGSTKLVGSEVHSAYWKRLNPSQPVRVVQLGAFHGSGKTESIFWGSKASPKFIGKHNVVSAQTVLPINDDASAGGASLDVSRTPPVEPFAFGVGGEWSDPTVNSKSIDGNNKYSICTPSPSDSCGQHMRFWPAQDQGGALMAGVYIMSMDYGSSSAVNWDFQDNVYLISNIQPASGVAPPPSDVPLERDDPGALLYRVDTGAPSGFAYTDTYGRKWVSDKNMPSGASFSPSSTVDENPNSNPISGTVEDQLFRSYRGKVGTSKPFTYHLPTGSATRVSIRLYFAERFFSDPAKRIFNIYVNNQLYLDNVDIWGRAGGKDAAYVITDDDIPVSGALDLKLQATVNNPSIAAFEVFDTSPGVVPPTPAPTATPAPPPVPTPTLAPPAPTPKPLPGPALLPTPTPTPAPGAGNVILSDDGTPLATPPTVSAKVGKRGTRGLKVTCKVSDPVSSRCRIEVRLGKRSSGRRLLVKRINVNGERASKTLKFSARDWRRIRAYGATVRIALLSADGKTTIAKSKRTVKVR